MMASQSHPDSLRDRHQAKATRHATCPRAPCRIGHTNTLPDRPEIRGMIARVPHLVTDVEIEVSRLMKIPRSQAGRRARTSARKRKSRAASVARRARPPAEATRANGRATP